MRLRWHNGGPGPHGQHSVISIQWTSVCPGWLGPARSLWWSPPWASSLAFPCVPYLSKGAVAAVAKPPSFAVPHTLFFFFLKISMLIISHFLRYFAFLQYFNDSTWSLISHDSLQTSPRALSWRALSGGFFFFFSFSLSAQSLNNVPVVRLEFQLWNLTSPGGWPHGSGYTDTMTQLCLEFQWPFAEAPQERGVMGLHFPTNESPAH